MVSLREYRTPMLFQTLRISVNAIRYRIKRLESWFVRERRTDAESVWRCVPERGGIGVA